MAKFLTTTGVSYRLEEIVKGASERLIIISPFLRVNQRIKELLEDKDRLKIDVRVIYGKNELQPEENNWLEAMTSIRTSFCENLHAKCYVNENEALLTSMNLYEFSQINNNEMGLLISRDEEPELYDEILQEAMRIIRVSEEIRVTVARVSSSDNATTRTRQNRARAATGSATSSYSRKQKRSDRQTQDTVNPPKVGFCIRCKSDVGADPAQPYCRRCYASWRRYENTDYEEKYCHLCGREHTTTQIKPVCFNCYRRYRNTFRFAAS